MIGQRPIAAGSSSTSESIFSSKLSGRQKSRGGARRDYIVVAESAHHTRRDISADEKKSRRDRDLPQKRGERRWTGMVAEMGSGSPIDRDRYRSAREVDPDACRRASGWRRLERVYIPARSRSNSSLSLFSISHGRFFFTGDF